MVYYAWMNLSIYNSDNLITCAWNRWKYTSKGLCPLIFDSNRGISQISLNVLTVMQLYKKSHSLFQGKPSFRLVFKNFWLVSDMIKYDI